MSAGYNVQIIEELHTLATLAAEMAAIPHHFLQLKMEEYEVLKAEIEALKFEVEKNGEQGTQKA